MPSDSQSIVQQSLIISSNQPQAAFEGQQWYDTGSESLKQWDGSSWVSVTTPPDGHSIIKDINGYLAVKKPSKQIFGSFETDSGDWIHTDLTGSEWSVDTTGVDSTRSQEGSQSIYAKYSTSSGDAVKKLGKYERTIDLTGIDTLTVKFFQTQSETNHSPKTEIDVAGNNKIDNSTADSWQTAEIDVSGETGENSVTIRHRSGSGSNDSSNTLEFWMDDIHADLSKRFVHNGSGN